MSYTRPINAKTIKDWGNHFKTNNPNERECVLEEDLTNWESESIGNLLIE